MITVYTALFTDNPNETFGGLYDYNGLRLSSLPYDIEFVCFTNCPYLKSDLWEIRQVDGLEEGTPRRTARKYKALSHEYFNSEYTLWLDNSCVCKVDFKLALEGYLKDHDWAVHRHIDRESVAQEAQICITRRLDSPKVIKEQLNSYVDKGFNSHANELFETGITMRRKTSAVIKANELWWEQIRTYSVRDQISLPFVFWMNPDLKVNKIDYTFCGHQSALSRPKTPHFSTVPRQMIKY